MSFSTGKNNFNYKHGKYSKKYKKYCKCGKIISPVSIKCKVCEGKSRPLHKNFKNTGKTQFKKNHTPWNKSKKMTQRYCENIRKSKTGIKNPNYGKPRSQGFKEKMKKIMTGQKRPNISKAMKGKYNANSIIKHHIYLKENSDKTIKMTRKDHRKLHSRAYDYIYYIYGKKGIKNFLNWFQNTYKGGD